MKKVSLIVLSLLVLSQLLIVNASAIDYKTQFIESMSQKGIFWSGSTGGNFYYMDLNSDNKLELLFTYYYSDSAATEIYYNDNGKIKKYYIGNDKSNSNTLITGIFNYYYDSASNKYRVFGRERTYNTSSAYYRDYELNINGNRVYKIYHSPWSSLTKVEVNFYQISTVSWQNYNNSQKKNSLEKSYSMFKYKNVIANKYPTSVKLNRGTLGLGVGENYGLVKTVSPSSANQSVTWTSSNTSVATVSSTGNVIGKKAGTATVTVKTSNGKTAKCTVTVKAAPTSVKTNPTSLKLGIGEKYTISESTNSGSYANAANLRWSSSNTSVAAIAKTAGTNKAVITAKKAGITNITIKTYNGKTFTCKLTVYAAPTSVKLSASSITLNKGKTYTISESTNSGSYANAANLKWSSTNTKVATVTKGSGNKATIKAVGKGTAYVKITLYNGKTAQCKVTVK